MAINIDGIICSYKTNEIPPKILDSFKQHCNYYNNAISNKPYHIIWKHIIRDDSWVISKMHHMCLLYNKPLHRVSHLRYLGAHLCTFDTDNLVSTKCTNAVFLNKLDQKARMLGQLDFNHSFISLSDKIRILKTFYLVYTEIFAQVLDSKTINLLSALQKQIDAIRKQTQITNLIFDQFSIFSGIPSPSERWVVLKLAFYWKLIKNKPISYMHIWSKLPNIRSYTLNKQYHDMKTKWLPNETRLIEGIPVEVDMFNTVTGPSELRPIVVRNQHIKIVNSFHDFHPLKILQHHLSDYQSMNTYELPDLDDFVKFAQSILDIAIEKSPSNLDELKSMNYNGGSLSVLDKITEEVGKIGEKLELSAYEIVEAGKVVAYNHPGNRLASMVGFSEEENLDDAGRDVAMQIAAMNPVSIDKEDVSEEIKNREIAVGKEQAREAGKPEEMLEKIAMGKLNKFYKESTLLNQQFIKDSKQTVKQYLESINKDLKVTSFKRIELG